MNFVTIDDAVEQFESLFLDVANRHAPLRTKRVRQRYTSPWLSEDILQAMRERNRLRKQACESGSPQIWAQFRNIKNKVNSMVKQAKKTYFTNALKTKDSKTIWENIRYIVPGKSKNVSIN